jgi:hypothetical protein
MKHIKSYRLFETWSESSGSGEGLLERTLLAALFYEQQEGIDDLTGETLKIIDEEEWGDYFLGEFESNDIDKALLQIGVSTVEELTNRYYLAIGEPLQNLSFPKGEDWMQPKDLLPALLELRREGFRYWGATVWYLGQSGMQHWTVFSKKKHRVGDLSMDAPIDAGFYYHTWWEGGWNSDSQDSFSRFTLN